MQRRWAFWRRVWYGGGVAAVAVVLLAWGGFSALSTPATCLDGQQNGEERGVDCGGACSLVCPLDAAAPVVRWAQAFRIADGRYHAVSYVENRNPDVGLETLEYTFTLYDEAGQAITTREGVTSLPPDGVYPLFAGGIETGGAVPARTELALGRIAGWHTADEGRFPETGQFEVRERTLSGVDLRPRLDTRVYNTSLEEATNVEIVATIFDAQGTPLTASQSVVPRFDPREEQSVVFTWPEPIAKTVRSCEVPSDVVLAVDLSGSMNDAGGTPPEPITSVLTAAQTFVAQLETGDRVGVVTYATDAARVLPLGSDRTAAASVLANLSIAPAEETGATNIGAAVQRAAEELASERHNPDARSVLVILTDGMATAPGEDPGAFALAQAAAAREQGVTVFAIGLGDRVDDTFLTMLADDASHHYRAVTRAGVEEIYRTVSTAICEAGPAVIDVIPKAGTPQ